MQTNNESSLFSSYHEILTCPTLSFKKKERQDKFLLGVKNQSQLILVNSKDINLFYRILGFIGLGPLKGIDYHIKEVSSHLEKNWSYISQEMDGLDDEKALKVISCIENIADRALKKKAGELASYIRRYKKSFNEHYAQLTSLRKEIKLVLSTNSLNQEKDLICNELLKEIIKLKVSLNNALLLFQAYQNKYEDFLSTCHHIKLLKSDDSLLKLFKSILSFNIENKDKIILLTITLSHSSEQTVKWIKDNETKKDFSELLTLLTQKFLKENFTHHDKGQILKLFFEDRNIYLLKKVATLPNYWQSYQEIKTLFPFLTCEDAFKILTSFCKISTEKHSRLLDILEIHIKDKSCKGSDFAKYIKNLIKDLNHLPSLNNISLFFSLLGDDWSFSHSKEINIKKAWDILKNFQAKEMSFSIVFLQKLYQKHLENTSLVNCDCDSIIYNLNQINSIKTLSLFTQVFADWELNNEQLKILLDLIKKIRSKSYLFRDTKEILSIKNPCFDQKNAFIYAVNLVEKLDHPNDQFVIIFNFLSSFSSNELELAKFFIGKNTLNLKECLNYLLDMSSQERKDLMHKALEIKEKGKMKSLSLTLLKVIPYIPIVERETTTEKLCFLLSKCRDNSSLIFIEKLAALDPLHYKKIIEITYDIMQKSKIFEINPYSYFMVYIDKMITNDTDQEILSLIQPFIEEYKKHPENSKNGRGFEIEEIGLVINSLIDFPLSLPQEKENRADIFNLFKAWRCESKSIINYMEFPIRLMTNFFNYFPLQERMISFNYINPLQSYFTPEKLFFLFNVISNLSEQDQHQIFNAFDIDQQVEIFSRILDKNLDVISSSDAISDFVWLCKINSSELRNEIFSNILNCYAYSSTSQNYYNTIVEYPLSVSTTAKRKWTLKHIKNLFSNEPKTSQYLEDEKKVEMRWLTCLPPNLLAKNFENIDDLSATLAMITPKGFQSIQQAYGTDQFSEKGKKRLHQQLQKAASDHSIDISSWANKRMQKNSLPNLYNDEKTSDMTLLIDNQKYFVHRSFLLCDAVQFFDSYLKTNLPVICEDHKIEAKIRLKILYGIPLEPQELQSPACLDPICRSVSFLHLYKQKIETNDSCILKIEGKSFLVHKFLLSQYSGYFRALFFTIFKENQNREIALDEINAETMEIFLPYIYSGEKMEFTDEDSAKEFQNILDRFIC